MSQMWTIYSQSLEDRINIAFIFCLLSRSFVCFCQWIKIINRPGVARAVLQTASSLIDWLIQSVREPFPPDLQSIITPKPLELESWFFERMFTPHHVSHVLCHVSHVMCHLSPVTCHLSCVTCHVSPVKCKKKSTFRRWPLSRTFDMESPVCHLMNYNSFGIKMWCTKWFRI